MTLSRKSGYTESVKLSAKTYYFSLLLGFLLLVVFLVGYLLETRKPEVPVAPVPEEVGDIKEAVGRLVHFPGNPIEKGTVEKERVVEYKLIGRFREELTFDSQKPNAPLAASFVLRGDPLERAIPVYVGSGSGLINFGEHQQSFEADSTWGWISMREFATQRYRQGEAVLIRVRSAATIESIRELEAVLDPLVREFDSGKHQLSIPEDFNLLTESVGVIR